jgi:hypothetical protein
LTGLSALRLTNDQHLRMGRLRFCRFPNINDWMHLLVVFHRRTGRHRKPSMFTTMDQPNLVSQD